LSKIYILKSEALIIFAKNPVAGKVKTRLAKSIGGEASVAVYKKLLQHTKEVAKHSSCEKYLYVNENIAAFSEWPDSVFSKHTQVSGQLGHKMEMAFGEILDKHEKVLIIGSDSPDITSSIINEAFTKLDIADVVIGPSTDGGYYLLGIKELSTFLFSFKP